MTDTSGIETPSGKAAGDENFPVGSILLPAGLRPHVAVFYRFARAADDIADNPDTTAGEKIARLDRFAAALRAGDGDPEVVKASRMKAVLVETGIAPRHCLDLLDAFRLDATKPRYADWDDLMDYCRLSAAPVGRFLLDLHGEDAALYPSSDALCGALQVLNHLQDCAADYKALDRVYIPLPWLEAEGLGVEALKTAHSAPGLRRVLDRMLDNVDGLLADAAPLAAAMKSRRLAMETAAIQAVAVRLSSLLRRRDPLAGRVALGPVAYALCMTRGVLKGLFR